MHQIHQSGERHSYELVYLNGYHHAIVAKLLMHGLWGPNVRAQRPANSMMTGLSDEPKNLSFSA